MPGWPGRMRPGIGQKKQGSNRIEAAFEGHEGAENLLAAIISDHRAEDAKRQMQMVLAHVTQHFHDEEALLAETGYPERAAYAAEHARLLVKARAFQNDMGGESADLPTLPSYLALDLVKGHLMCGDRKFFKWMEETRV